MTAGRNWDRARDRSRVARQGAETIDGSDVLFGPPKARKAKSELRDEIASAVIAPGAMVTRIVKCGCGHKATVKIPAARLPARLVCSKCGEIVQ